jgi:hypothetical protein
MAGVGSTQLNTTGVASGVYGNATNIPVFTVDTNGRVTAATTIPATISGYVPTSTQVIAGNGLTGGGALNGNVTLAASYSATLPQQVSKPALLALQTLLLVATTNTLQLTCLTMTK